VGIAGLKLRRWSVLHERLDTTSARIICRMLAIQERRQRARALRPITGEATDDAVILGQGVPLRTRLDVIAGRRPIRQGHRLFGNDPPLTIRAPAGPIAAIDAWAAKENLARSEAMRQLIEARLKRRPGT
jgi:hypothetical protein